MVRADLPSRDVLVDCVRTATLAPSVHNSQPWRFRITDAAVEVHAAPERRLPVIDPAGREQLISVGAAVFTLRLALSQAGYRSSLTVLPDAGRPDLVGRVTVTGLRPPDPMTEALAAAVAHRHTNRWPFAHIPVASSVTDRLRDAARREGAVLTVASDSSRDVVLELARSADRWLRRTPGYREELARWTADGVRLDGVPAGAAGPWDSLEVVPTREFAGFSPRSRPTEAFEPYPAILVLATEGDTRVEWVRAGQALQRVLLTATWKNLATMPISQPVEVPAIRCRLTDPGGGSSAQVLLRVGYGRTTVPAPRRPLSEVLLPG